MRGDGLQIDPREAGDIAAALAARRPGYLNKWQPPEEGPGAALVGIYARYLEAILDRLNQVPDKSRLAFLDLLGIELIPARPARAPIVFRLAEAAPAVHLPAGAQVAAPAPPESPETGQLVFETERGVGLTPAQIKQVVTLWPGRDQYIDHSEKFATGETIRPFDRALLKDTPHTIYIAHDTLLNLTGQVSLDVEFEFSQAGSAPLDTIWQYWDGQVWRNFKAQRAECAERDTPITDGTAGFTRNGRIRLSTDCGESAQREVNGNAAFWIRGRLDDTLPLDPNRILPEVTQIRLSNAVERPLSVALVSRTEQFFQQTSPAEIKIVLKDTNDTPIEGAVVELEATTAITNSDGYVIFKPTNSSPQTYQTRISVFDSKHELRVTYEPPSSGHLLLHVQLTFQLGGLQPDNAFSNADALDLTGPFFPLGQQPQPGSSFYFTSEELFSKPGARFSLHVTGTTTPQDEFDVVKAKGSDDVSTVIVDKTLIDRRINWEYWNGRTWIMLKTFSSSDANNQSPAGDFSGTDTLEFVVPDDIKPVKVNDQEAHWMRARLVSGGYGFRQIVTFDGNDFQSVISQPPALADFRISYTWEYGPFHAERVLAFNDFRYSDASEVARWPGSSFKPFEQVADQLPALYIGHSQPLPVDRVNLFFDLIETKSEAAAQSLVWEYWNGFRWREVSVEEETRNLSYSGMVSLLGPADAGSRARFEDEELYWLRARLKEDGPPPTPQIRGIHLNAVWASQQQTLGDETLGTSSGLPNQVFSFRRPPVLDDALRADFRERVEVRELVGERANVEWRILARQLLRGDQLAIRELEQQLADEGTAIDVQRGDLRLRRDRTKRVTEVWVRWKAEQHFYASSANDRHYLLDRAAGLLRFGDGRRGKTPPLGAIILARQYRSGGGRAGNVASGQISQPLTGVAGVESISNPRPAEGGADGETLTALAERGPHTLRHRGRAITPGDYETMAIEASPAVAVAQALPARDAAGRPRAGWTTLIIIPRSKEPRPMPSPGLRDEVRRFIEQRAAGELADANRIAVIGPEYRPVDVQATIAPADVSRAGEVEVAVRAAIQRFLHPLDGGPRSNGWPSGRDVYLSDLAAVLERVEVVDYVRDLTLLLEGVPQGESAAIPAGKFVVAGEILITLTL